MTDEYRDLIEAARDALRALLLKTEPGTGQQLHTVYRDLGEMLKAADAKDAEAPPTSQHVDHDRERREFWRKLPRVLRQNRVLNALGDGCLTIRQLTERVNADPDLEVYEPEVQNTVYKLLDQHDVERRRGPNPLRKGTTWFYKRRTDLSPDVADLERVYRGDVVTTE